jgi:BlaI family penicillinase repressor
MQKRWLSGYHWLSVRIDHQFVILRNSRTFTDIPIIIMEQLTPHEEATMRAIWQVGPGFVRDFITAMYPLRLPYTTLASTIKNLEKKGYVKSERVANAYRYSAKIKEADYKKKYVNGMVNNFFQDSYKDLVAFFAKENKISKEDLKEIIDMIDKSEK